MSFDSNQNTVAEVDRNKDKNDDILSSKDCAKLVTPFFADKDVKDDDTHLSLKSEIILPSGRRPFCIVPGLDYGLDDSIIVGDEDLGASPPAAKYRSRKESYLVNSFVCENGYLSEDEMMSTPVSDWKTKRDKIVKNKKDSEKKRWKLKIKGKNNPELINNTSAKSSKSTKLKLKKYQAVIFATHSIQTGLSVEYQLMQEVQNNNKIHIYGNLSSEDRCLALNIAKLAMNGNNDKSNNDGLNRIEKMLVDDSEVVHVSDDETDENVEGHGYESEVLHADDPLDVDTECMKIAADKYNLYYLVKNMAKNIMQRCGKIPPSPALLLIELRSNIPNLSNQPEDIQIDYAAKFYSKYLK